MKENPDNQANKVARLVQPENPQVRKRKENNMPVAQNKVKAVAAKAENKTS
jgi:hypothetical protein